MDRFFSFIQFIKQLNGLIKHTMNFSMLDILVTNLNTQFGEY